MGIRAEISDGVFRLRAEGHLGVQEAFELRDAIASGIQGASMAVVDLSLAESLGGPCIQVLYSLWVEAASWGMEVRMGQLSDPALRCINLCGLGGFFGLDVRGRAGAR